MDITEKLSFVSADDEYGAAEVPQLITDLTVVDDRLVIHRADGSEDVSQAWAGSAASEVEKLSVNERGEWLNHMSSTEVISAGHTFRRTKSAIPYCGVGLVKDVEYQHPAYNSNLNDLHPSDAAALYMFSLTDGQEITQISPGKWRSPNGIVIESVDVPSTVELRKLFSRTDDIFSSLTNRSFTLNFSFPEPTQMRRLEVKRPTQSGYPTALQIVFYGVTNNILVNQNLNLTAANTTYTFFNSTAEVKSIRLTAMSFTGTTERVKWNFINLFQVVPMKGVNTENLRLELPHFQVEETDSDFLLSLPSVRASGDDGDTQSITQNVLNRSCFQITKTPGSTLPITFNGLEQTIQFPKVVFDGMQVVGRNGVFHLTPGLWKFHLTFTQYVAKPGALGLFLAGSGIQIYPFVPIAISATTDQLVEYCGEFHIPEKMAVCFRFCSTGQLIDSSPFLRDVVTGQVDFWFMGKNNPQPTVIDVPGLGLKKAANHQVYGGYGTSQFNLLTNPNYGDSTVNFKQSSLDLIVYQPFRIWAKCHDRTNGPNPIQLFKCGSLKSWIPWGIQQVGLVPIGDWELLTVSLPPGAYSIEELGGYDRNESKWFIEALDPEEYAKDDILTTPHSLTDVVTSAASSKVFTVVDNGSLSVTYQPWKLFDGLPLTGWQSKSVTDMVTTPIILTVTFTKLQQVTGYHLIHRSGVVPDTGTPVSWEVSYLADDGKLVKCHSQVNNLENPSIREFALEQPIQTTQLQFVFTKTTGNTMVSLSDLMIMGTTSWLDPLLH